MVLYKKSITLLLISFLLMFLPACFSSRDQETPKQTYFIQVFFDSPVLAQVKKTITPVINEIIKEELGLEKEYQFDFFIPKTHSLQLLTVYYVNDMRENGQTLLFSVVDDIEKNWSQFAPQKVHVSAIAEFFGAQKDELVTIIDDPEGELSRLNRDIKEAMHCKNDEYKQLHQHDLYDIAASERYDFVPHTGLGRIRSQSIKNHIKDASQIEAIFERIRERSLKITLETIAEALNENNRSIIFNKLSVYNFTNRACLKEYVLKINF